MYYSGSDIVSHKRIWGIVCSIWGIWLNLECNCSSIIILMSAYGVRNFKYFSSVEPRPCL